jgi:hypothetical protein
MNFGYTGCHTSVPSLQKLAVYTAQALAELEAAVAPASAAVATDAEPVAKPAAKREAEPAAKRATKRAVKPAAKPLAKRARKPVPV